MITITEQEYASLLLANYKLECLEAAGVDNWDYYYLAMNEHFDDMLSYDELSKLDSLEIIDYIEDI